MICYNACALLQHRIMLLVVEVEFENRRQYSTTRKENWSWRAFKI